MTQPDPWFRMYHSTLDNPKVQKLAGEQFKAWVNLLCLACRHGGRLPKNSDIAFALRVQETRVEALLKRFIDVGLIDAEGDGLVMHDWDTLQFKSDVSTTRVKQYRERQRNVSSNVSETPRETDQSRAEQIQSRTEKKEGPSAQDVSALLSKTTEKITGRGPPNLPKDERRNIWKGKILKEAQPIMSDKSFIEFADALAKDLPWAQRKADEIDKLRKARQVA